MGCLGSIEGNWMDTREDAVNNLLEIMRDIYDVNAMKVIKYGRIALEYEYRGRSYTSLVTIMKDDGCYGSHKYYAYISI